MLIMRVLLSLYGQNYNPQLDWFLLTEESNEKIVFLGEFKNVDEIIICDNRLFDKCGLEWFVYNDMAQLFFYRSFFLNLFN